MECVWRWLGNEAGLFLALRPNGVECSGGINWILSRTDCRGKIAALSWVTVYAGWTDLTYFPTQHCLTIISHGRGEREGEEEAFPMEGGGGTFPHGRGRRKLSPWK